MISQTTEYALRAMVFLATEPETSHTAQVVAHRTRTATGYMSKVLQSLGDAGLVHAQRGRHGGFRLALPPEEISILDVVNAIDPIRRIERCPLGIPGHKALCPLHRRLDEAAELIEDQFRSVTLAQLLEEPGDSRPLCDPDKPAPKRKQRGRKKKSRQSSAA